MKNSLARSEILGSGSSKHFAISPSCPLTLIIPFKIKCVKTMRVFFLTTRLVSESPLYSSLLLSSKMLLKQTATSPSAMTMLLRVLGSFELFSRLNKIGCHSSQYWELTQRNLLSERTAAPRRIRFFSRGRKEISQITKEIYQFSHFEPPGIPAYMCKHGSIHGQQRVLPIQ